MDCIHDYRINADNYSLNMTISEYYELVKDCLNDNEYQRKRVRNSSSIYNLLKQDIIKGCVMPPIVLALCKPLSCEKDIMKAMHNARGNLKILDGLQRSYTNLDLMGIANSRKETRHYNASPQSPHPALTNQEAELYFQRIDILALDIIRIRLGLPKIAVEDEK